MAASNRALGVCPDGLSVLVHEYNDIDHRIVHEAIGTALEQFSEYVEAASWFVEDRGFEAG